MFSNYWFTNGLHLVAIWVKCLDYFFDFWNTYIKWFFKKGKFLNGEISLWSRGHGFDVRTSVLYRAGAGKKKIKTRNVSTRKKRIFQKSRTAHHYLKPIHKAAETNFY